jgi:hypothetical protein
MCVWDLRTRNWDLGIWDSGCLDSGFVGKSNITIPCSGKLDRVVVTIPPGALLGGHVGACFDVGNIMASIIG